MLTLIIGLATVGVIVGMYVWLLSSMRKSWHEDDDTLRRLAELNRR